MGVRPARRHSAVPTDPHSGVRARPWPREHGAWAILLVSFGVGWAAAWEFDVRILPLVVASIFALAVRTHVLDAVMARSPKRLWPWGVSDRLVSLADLGAAAVGRPCLFGMAVVGSWRFRPVRRCVRLGAGAAWRRTSSLPVRSR